MTNHHFTRVKNAAILGMSVLMLSHCGGGAAVGANVPSTSGTGTTGTTSSPAPGASATPKAGASSSPIATSSATPIASSTGTPSANEDASIGIPFPAATDADAFYSQPSPFPAVPHGTILGSRSSVYAPDGVMMSNTAYQVKFASQDIYGRKIAAVETIVLPLAASNGNLLVEALAEDSLAAKCAPSHFISGAATSDTEEIEATGVPQTGLMAGDTLLYPDFEGPFSEYAVGRQEGLITLDAETAALNFTPAGLNAKTPIGQNGYSGGAHAVSWAAALQPSYAPTLNLIGTASGGTPADILNILENIDGTSALSVASNGLFFDIIYMSGVGINRGFPNFLTPIFNAKGVAAAAAMENGCGGDNSDGSSGPTGHIYEYTNDTATSLDTDPHVTVNTAADSEPQPGLYPKSNVFLYASMTDELIPPEGATKLDAAWCADGSTIEYFEDAAGGDHVTTEVDNIPVAALYFQERFGGLPLTIPSTMNCN